ncbi:hypothetical protein T310_5528, partial [Rasamsonia emersonii CBS 393.64]
KKKEKKKATLTTSCFSCTRSATSFVSSLVSPQYLLSWPSSIYRPAWGPVFVTGGNGYIMYHITAKIFEEEPQCIIRSLDINTTRSRHPNANVHYHLPVRTQLGLVN